MNSSKNKYVLYIMIALVAIVLTGFVQFALEDPGRDYFESGWSTFGTDDRNLRADLLSSLNWTDYEFGKKAAESTKDIIWFRAQLPEYIPDDTHLQLYLNDNSMEVFIDGTKIYSFGDVYQVGDKVSYGSPFHMISIPRSAEGHHIYIKTNAFFSRNSGILRHCFLDTDMNILTSVFRNDIDDLVISIVLIIAAFVLNIAFFMTGTRVSRASIYLSFASLVTGIWMFSETGVKQLIFNNPRLWLYVAFTTFYLIPIGYIKYSSELFAVEKHKRFLNALPFINVLWLVVSLVVDLLKIQNIVYMLDYYLLIMLFEMVALVYAIIYSAAKGNNYAGLFVIGIIVTSVLTLYDIFGMIFHLVPWSSIRMSYGMFVFMFILIYILVSHIQDIYAHEAENAVEILTKNQELEALNTELEENKKHLIEANTNLEKTVSERTASLQALLDNAGQGFLMFGKNMEIDSSCSSECSRIFEKDVRGLDYGELIYSDNKDQRNYLKNVLQTIIQLPDDSYNEKYLSLLPTEVFYKNKILDLKYRIIREERQKIGNVCMVIITDITATKILSKRMEEEEAQLKNIVKVAAYTRDFVELTESFRYFVTIAFPELLVSNNLIGTKIGIIRKRIHYYKGSFGIFGFREMLDALNELEMNLKEIQKEESPTEERLQEEFEKYNLLIKLNEILNFVARTLSMEFKDRIDSVRVSRSKMRELAERIDQHSDMEEFAREIRQLTYRDFFVLMAKYVVFTDNLAERLEKNVEQLKIEGGNFLIDPSRYEAFTNSLVHVFRNALDHGIESEVERIKEGKRAIGHIGCRIELNEDRIWVFIEDDGRGIDFEALERKAIEIGLVMPNERIGNEELMGLILKGKLSSKEEANDISGFGLGLSIVAEETEKLGGTLKIESVAGKSTRIFFDIPYFM